MSLFIEQVFENDKELTRTIFSRYEQLLRLWRENAQIRDDNHVEDSQLYDLSIRLTKLLSQFYEEISSLEFETILITSTINLYRVLGDKWLQNNESINYIQQVFKAINENLKFFTNSMKNTSFIKKLFDKLRWQLIFIDFNNLLPRILPFLLDNPKELSIIYNYCVHTEDQYGLDSIAILVYQWGLFTKKVFEDVIANNKQKKTVNLIIGELVDKFKHFKRLIDTNFSSDRFEFELRNSLIKTINGQTNNNSLLIYQLCKYCDNFYKKKSDISITDFEDNVLIIFKAINNKQDFINFYKKDLSKRLFFNVKFNFDGEQKLASKLNEVIGSTDEAISINTMFQDLTISKEIYKPLMAKNSVSSDLLSRSFEFNPLILDKRQWPEIPNNEDLSELKIPPMLQSLLDQMSNEYKQLDPKYKSRQLDWTNYKLHQITISASFQQGTKEITGNLLQIMVILLFDDNDCGFNVDELVEKTGINENFLLKILNSISTDKYNIIVSHQGKYYFNNEFTDKSTKIKLPMIKESSVRVDSNQKEQDELTSNIQTNRDEEFKSCVIKIMKQERELNIVNLLNQSIAMLERRQPVNITNLKTIVENLIQMEFLKRDDNNKDVIIYIP
ncbi:Cul4b Cullin-4B [Candida maltosa Xu316]